MKPNQKSSHQVYIYTVGNQSQWKCQTCERQGPLQSKPQAEAGKRLHEKAYPYAQ